MGVRVAGATGGGRWSIKRPTVAMAISRRLSPGMRSRPHWTFGLLRLVAARRDARRRQVGRAWRKLTGLRRQIEIPGHSLGCFARPLHLWRHRREGRAQGRRFACFGQFLQRPQATRQAARAEH